jgi:MoaA/NifB/PqqE/SkfB family radical SAM enzyme
MFVNYINSIIKKTNNLLYSRIEFKELLPIEDHDFVEHFSAYNRNRRYGFDKTFCYAPQNSLYFKYNGDVIACCKNNNDVYGNMLLNTLDDVWNSATKKQLAGKIKNYEFKEGCDFCFKQLKSKNYNGIHANLYDNYYNRFTNFEYPTDITFEISNKCNLECIMCDGFRSSSIRKNREKLDPRPYQYPNNFLEQLIPYIPHFKVVRLQGGEPFLIPFYLDLIDKIGELNSKCKIYIQTNGTILSERVQKLLKNKQIDVSISIDAFNQFDFEFIRKNANYDQVMQNVLTFNEISKKNNKQLNINFCILKNNVLKIHEAFDFCEKHGLHLELLIVDHPTSLSIAHVDSPTLEKVTLYLKSCLKKYPKFVGKLNDILNFIESNKNLHYSNVQADDFYQSFLEINQHFIPKENISLQSLTNKIEFWLRNVSEEDKKYILSCLLLDTAALQKTTKVRDGNLDEYLAVYFSRLDILLKVR